MRRCEEIVFKLFAQLVVARFYSLAGLPYVEDAVNPAAIIL